MKVYVAIHEHRHGMDVNVYDTWAGAEAWKEEIARENWDRVSEDPLLEDDCADEYFDLVHGEWFRIEECHVNESNHA